MSTIITAHLLSGVKRSENDASLISLPGHQIAACIFENNFNKVYLSVPSEKNISSHPSYVIKSIAVDLSPTDVSELLFQTDSINKKGNNDDEENVKSELQLDVSASLAAEINILKIASHSSIIALHEVYCELSTFYGTHLYLSK